VRVNPAFARLVSYLDASDGLSAGTHGPQAFLKNSTHNVGYRTFQSANEALT
jgi:hypothetical protein